MSNINYTQESFNILLLCACAAGSAGKQTFADEKKKKTGACSLDPEYSDQITQKRSKLHQVTKAGRHQNIPVNITEIISL